jgi:membrane-associated phospholipid phosphatase
MKSGFIAIVLAVVGSGMARAQDGAEEPGTPPDPQAKHSDASDEGRPISIGKLVPNILHDQKLIYLFPAHLNKKRNLIPALVFLGATAALIATDPYDTPYFRRTTSYTTFNHVFSGTNTSVATAAIPVGLYAFGFVTKDKKLKDTGLLVGEAVADSEILATVLKDTLRRARPGSIEAKGNFSDTFFEGKRGGVINGDGSMPSGHTIAAFSIATIFSRQYGHDHKWVPYVSYGTAALVGLSRLTGSAHFPSDIFVGGVLGYSVSRFAVLHE